jgi:hypothetical protein
MLLLRYTLSLFHDNTHTDRKGVSCYCGWIRAELEGDGYLKFR